MRIWLELEHNPAITGYSWPRYMIRVGEAQNWKGFVLDHQTSVLDGDDYREKTLGELLESKWAAKRLAKIIQDWLCFEWQAKEAM